MRNVRLETLIEREKELNCLYSVEEILRKNKDSLDSIINRIIEVMPSGWQYSTVCESRVKIRDKVYQSPDFRETEWMQSTEIIVDENIVGNIDVVYTQLIRMHGSSPFLPHEQKLLNTIADRLGDYIFYKELKNSLDFLKNDKPDSAAENMPLLEPGSDEHWKWRLKMSQHIADKLNFDKFAVKAVYICGSTKEATAGPRSDIDLIVHQEEDNEKKELLSAWIDGWGLCLSELNFLRTGHTTDRSLIDLHIITDEDIRKKSSFASMIGSCHNSARPLKIKEN